MNHILLITLSGKDQPGVTAAITGILSQHNVSVLDVGQAVIHSTLSLGLLVELPEDSVGDIASEIQEFAQERDLAGSDQSSGAGALLRLGGGAGSPRYIITLLARKITADQIARVTSVVSEHGLNIDGINRLSGRIPLGELPALSKACVEFSARGALPDPAAFRRGLLEVASALEADLAFQQDNMYRRNRRLVAFDMDSTLIEAEVIDELAKLAGVGDR